MPHFPGLFVLTLLCSSARANSPLLQQAGITNIAIAGALTAEHAN